MSNVTSLVLGDVLMVQLLPRLPYRPARVVRRSLGDGGVVWLDVAYVYPALVSGQLRVHYATIESLHVRSMTEAERVEHCEALLLIDVMEAGG